MLILAGVSINAIVGDNGIITKAQTATYMQSVAALQEFMQLEYTSEIEKIDDYETKLDYFINEKPDYLYRPNASTPFITDTSTGYIYYLINKDGLPEDIKKQLKGGNAGDKTYYDYATFNDVYGITEDLEVFYCSNGKDTRIGAVDPQIIDDPERVVIKSDSNLGNYLKNKYNGIVKVDENGNIISENLSSVKSFEINNETGITSLKELYNLPALQEIIIKNMTLSSLEGLENLKDVTYIYIENCTIGDYSQMKNLKNLSKLWLYNTNDNELKKLCDGIATAEFSKLTNFGIFGYDSAQHDNKTWLTSTKNSNIRNIAPLSSLSTVTKQAIKTLYLNNNYITDISPISEFTSLQELRLQQNAILDVSALLNMKAMNKLFINNNVITSLNGLQNMTVLKQLYAQNNQLGKNENTTKNESTDALKALDKITTLNYLNMENNPFKWVGYLSTCSGVNQLYLNNCPNILDMANIANVLKKCGGNCGYDTKYALALASDVEKLDLSGQTYNIDFFTNSLRGKTNIKYLSLKNLKLTQTSGGKEVAISDATLINSTLNGLLETLTGLKTLQLYGIKGLSEIKFVNQVTGLTELDLRGTMVTTGTKDSSNNYTGLDLLNTKGNALRTLVLDSTNTTTPINCVNIQPTISRLVYGMQTGCWVCTFGLDGGLLATDTIYKTLENCTTMTKLEIGRHNYGRTSVSLNLSRCSALRTARFCLINGELTFPTGLTSVDMRMCLGKHIYGSGSNISNIFDQYCYSGVVNDTWLKNFWEGLRNINKVQNLTVPFGSFNNLGDFTTLINEGKTINIGTLNLNGLTAYDMRIDLSGIENLKINTLNVTNYNTVTNLDKVARVSGLTVLNIHNEGGSKAMPISNIDFISTMTGLTKLTIRKAQISDLSPLVTLNRLTYLDLSKNSISNTIQTSAGLVNNVEILNNLHKGSLGELHIADNQFTDLSELSWAKSK